VARAKRTLVVLGAAVVATMLIGSAALAAPTDLDTSFGNQGVAQVPVSTTLNSEGHALAIDSSGRVIVVGDIASSAAGISLSTPTSNLFVSRFTPTGTLDSSFGQAGSATVDLTGVADATGVAVESNGDIVLAVNALTVSSTEDVTGLAAYVVRLTPTGVPDGTFGTDGEVHVLGSSPAFVTGIAVDSSGNILVSGSTASSLNADSGNAFVERLTSTGTPDSTFGTAGVQQVSAASDGNAVAVTPDGHVLLAGDSTGGLAVWRLTSAGALDTTFGTDGQVTTPLPLESSATDLIAQASGSIDVIGGAGIDPVVVQLTSTGAVDTTFGDQGAVGVDIPGGVESIGGALDPSTGDIVLGGGGGTTGVWLARLTSTGAPDRTFAPDGIADPAIEIGDTGAFGALGAPGVTATGQPVIPGIALTASAGSGSTTTTSSTSTSTTSADDTFTNTPTLSGAQAAVRFEGGSGTATPPADTATRISGSDRIATAIADSQATFATFGTPDPTRVDAGGVVLASADNFPDALVGTPLAESMHAPLLLTEEGTLDPTVMTEIQRVLGPGSNQGTVVILGGTLAISSAVEDAITSAGYTVNRIAGPDRFATAVDVAQAMNPDAVLLATGDDFADGVTAGAAAAHIGGAVLLTDGTTEPTETSSYLSSAGLPEYAVGGPAAAAVPSATAIVGSNRYDTAAKVATAFFVTPSGVGVATGLQFPDALSGGSRAAELGEPMLLTDPDTLSPETQSYLQGLASYIDTADVFGGTLAITDGVVSAVQAAITAAAASGVASHDVVASGLRAGAVRPPWVAFAATLRAGPFNRTLVSELRR
jgi:uncharacterized delta-60 repeat protein